MCSEVGQSTLVFGLIGFGVGAFVGMASSSERWKLIGADAVHVSLAPHGLGLAVSLTF